MRSIALKMMLLFISTAIFSSCRDENTFPAEPQITFKDMVKKTTAQGIDESADLVISFTDGDGDIGLSSRDTAPPYDPSSIYYYNFYIKYFVKQNGVFNELQLLIPSHQRIPFIENDNRNKALNGDIIMNISFFGFTFNNDTVRFEAFIYDRALHKSNTVTTSEIILKTL